MAKGISIKFRSYAETIPKLLEVIQFDKELQKHQKIVLKPCLREDAAASTPPEFVEAVLQFCLTHKILDTQIFIAEGADGEETKDAFTRLGYQALAEKYGIGLLDLNDAEVKELHNKDFLKFESIYYPKVLLDSFIISLPKLREEPETDMQGALSIMIGIYPASHYRGFFSAAKNKIKKWPVKYSIHDILKCKMPEFAIIDASEKGVILAGKPLEMDLQAAKLLGKEWKSVGYLKLVQESFVPKITKKPQESTGEVVK